MARLVTRLAATGEPGPDTQHVIDLLDAYRRTPNGGASPLADDVRQRLIRELPRQPNLIALLCLDQESPVGCAIGFHDLYLFSGQPVANMQFLFVLPAYQRRGIARELVQAFEARARALDCARVTLEVRAGNDPAKALYAGMDYQGALFGPRADKLELWEKAL